MQFPRGLCKNLRPSKARGRKCHPSNPVSSGSDFKRSGGGGQEGTTCPTPNTFQARPSGLHLGSLGPLFLFSGFLGALTAISSCSKAYGHIITGPKCLHLGFSMPCGPTLKHMVGLEAALPVSQSHCLIPVTKPLQDTDETLCGQRGVGGPQG